MVATLLPSVVERRASRHIPLLMPMLNVAITQLKHYCGCVIMMQHAPSTKRKFSNVKDTDFKRFLQKISDKTMCTTMHTRLIGKDQVNPYERCTLIFMIIKISNAYSAVYMTSHLFKLRISEYFCFVNFLISTYTTIGLIAIKT